jgi:protein-S-isoprenylcysteine O-methyltransferase Ste14
MSVEEQDIRSIVFKYRSYTPIPFLIVMLVFARPTLPSLVVGFAITLLGECVRFWGVSIAGSETRTTGSVGGTFLITNGPFAYTRNPLYLGNMLLYLGVGIMSMALFPWLQIVALVWFYVQYSLIVSKEEEYLADRFGVEYAEYKAKVRRFLPVLAKYETNTTPPKRVNPKEGLSSERRTLQAVALVTLIIVVIYFFQQQSG